MRLHRRPSATFSFRSPAKSAQIEMPAVRNGNAESLNLNGQCPNPARVSRLASRPPSRGRGSVRSVAGDVPMWPMHVRGCS